MMQVFVAARGLQAACQRAGQQQLHSGFLGRCPVDALSFTLFYAESTSTTFLQKIFIIARMQGDEPAVALTRRRYIPSSVGHFSASRRERTHGARRRAFTPSAFDFADQY